MRKPTEHLSCPRCGVRIGHGDEGAYRSVAVSRHWCGGCAIFVFARANLVPLQLALAQSHRVKEVDAPCPVCAGRLTRWLVTHGDRMLELEACRECGVVVLDSDELEPAIALLAGVLPGLGL